MRSGPEPKFTDRATQGPLGFFLLKEYGWECRHFASYPASDKSPIQSEPVLPSTSKWKLIVPTSQGGWEVQRFAQKIPGKYSTCGQILKMNFFFFFNIVTLVVTITKVLKPFEGPRFYIYTFNVI